MALKFIISLFAGLIIYSFAYAASGVPPSAIITYHYYNGIGGLLVAQQTMANPDSCRRSDLYILLKEHPLYKEITALILSAHITGQVVELYVGECYDGFPIIQHVQSRRP